MKAINSLIISLIVLIFLALFIPILALDAKEDNISATLISAIQTKTIPLNTFNGLSKSNQQRFLDVGGQIDYKDGK